MLPTRISPDVERSNPPGGGDRTDRKHPKPDSEGLFRENFQFVRRAVASSLGPADPDLDDVVQDVFMVAMDKLHTYDGSSKVTTWLWGIAWRVVSQHRRRRRLRQFFRLDEDDAVRTNHAPEVELAAQRALREIYAILDRMAEKRRQVLILYELEGYSGREIADILGCKTATVWTRLHHARRDFLDRAQKSAGAREWLQPSLDMTGRGGQ